MKKPLINWLNALTLAMLLGTTPLAADTPQLVLFVTVDQLRGDMPMRYLDRLAPGGFRYLMDNGTVYANAHYQHLVTTTAAGHATLSTGSNTPRHGIASNEWFNADTMQSVYNTEDVQHPIIGVPGDLGKGRSPRNLTSSTFGDELVISNNGKSRVFTISIKDRAAILLGGRLGKAYWYSRPTGKFVTSTYYRDAYPDWVNRWNAQGHADQYRNTSWELLLEPDSYVFKDQDDRWFEKSPKNLGRTFPHQLGNVKPEEYYSSLRYVPMGDELTLAFVQELVAREKVGQSGHTDILAVSFSVTDYIGHAYGPNSLEAEDNLLRLDRTLQKLFQFIDQQVGLDNTLVVLTSDHGVSPAPEYMAAKGFDARRHNMPQLMQRLNTALQQRFNTRSDLAIAFYMPGIYLDVKTMGELGLEVAAVERELAAEIMKVPGFSLALTKTDLLAGQVPDTEAARRASRSFHPNRSGNVIVAQDPFWYLASSPNGDATTHGSPHNYDSHVPIMMAGPGIGQGSVKQRVAPADVAPTISAYLGVAPPSGSTGTPLPGIH